MSATSSCPNDTLKSLVARCVVFPADGSKTRVVHMFTRTVPPEEDNPWLEYQGRQGVRCVDVSRTFGDDYRKTRVTFHRTDDNAYYLMFHNLSPNLPINLNIAQLIGVTPFHLKTNKHLFWRGDVVAMKLEGHSFADSIHDPVVRVLDADLSELGALEDFLLCGYQQGDFRRLLAEKEMEWDFYVQRFGGPTSSRPFDAPMSYWGPNAAEKEELFLQDLNELRCASGYTPLPRHIFMKSYTEHIVDLYSGFRSVLGLHQKVTEPPKLPLELERQVFEMCALDSSEYCTVLVLVAKRVYAWIDPILIATVCLDNLLARRRNKVELFIAKLTNGRPIEYYAQHVKNLAIFDHSNDEEVNRILATCAGIKNLVLHAQFGVGLGFLNNAQATRNLRRLTIKMSRQFGFQPNFHHPCFANLTHLHLWDNDEDWGKYAGWETLTCLTHLAFPCSGPREQVVQVMQILPTIRYVALGHCYAWDARIVALEQISTSDWEQGTRGESDFWDLVEQEVERRLEERSVD